MPPQSGVAFWLKEWFRWYSIWILALVPISCVALSKSHWPHWPLEKKGSPPASPLGSLAIVINDAAGGVSLPPHIPSTPTTQPRTNDWQLWGVNTLGSLAWSGQLWVSYTYTLVCIIIPGGLVKIQHAGPTPEFLIQQVWGGDLRICTSNKFPGDADAAGLGTTLWESLTYRISRVPLSPSPSFPFPSLPFSTPLSHFSRHAY